jgi:hypothetical protein
MNVHQKMLTEAMLGAAQAAPSTSPLMIASAMLDAYGPEHAVAVADTLPRLILREQASRRGVQPMPRPDMAAMHPATGEAQGFSPWADDLPSAFPVVAFGVAIVVLAIAAVFAVAAFAAVDGVQAQIAAGAAEW